MPRAKLHNTYSASEIGTLATVWNVPPEVESNGEIVIGQPVANTRIHLVDARSGWALRIWRAVLRAKLPDYMVRCAKARDMAGAFPKAIGRKKPPACAGGSCSNSRVPLTG